MTTAAVPSAAQQPILDVAVGAFAPVAQVSVAELVPEKGDHAILRHPLRFADGAHVAAIVPTISVAT